MRQMLLTGKVNAQHSNNDCVINNHALTANLPPSLCLAKAGSSVGSREQTPDSSREKGLPEDHHHL